MKASDFKWEKRQNIKQDIERVQSGKAVRDRYRATEKGKRKRAEYNKKYYGATRFKYKPRPWTPIEDELIINHEIPDAKMSDVIKRSVNAIQVRRSKLVTAFGTYEYSGFYEGEV